MELREYYKIIKRYWKLFWVVVIVATAFAYIFTKIQPQTYLASTTLTVNKSGAIKQSQTDYYLFDNYYNIQSSALYSQIIVSWFESPAVVKEIYTKANISLPPVSQKKLSKIFKAVREEPATINVTLSGTDKNEIDKLINSAADTMQEKTNEIGKSDKDNIYDIVKFTPVITETTPNLLLNIIIGLISGMILGAILALATAYFREEK